jgi:hypothetical protein
MTHHYRDTTFIAEEHKTLRVRIFAGSARAFRTGRLWARQRDFGGEEVNMLETGLF